MDDLNRELTDWEIESAVPICINCGAVCIDFDLNDAELCELCEELVF